MCTSHKAEKMNTEFRDSCDKKAWLTWLNFEVNLLSCRSQQINKCLFAHHDHI